MLSANVAARVPLEPRGHLNCTQSQKRLGESSTCVWKNLSANVAARVPLEPRGQLNFTQSQT